MSTWTHVCGIIRIDDVRMITGTTSQGLRAKFAADAPEGSEGGLEIYVWDNPMREHMAAYTVSVHGDLRDYETPQAVIDWFISSTKGCLIRQGCIQAVCEDGTTARHEWVTGEFEPAKT